MIAYLKSFKKKQWLAIIAVFISGAVVGGLVGSIASYHHAISEIKSFRLADSAERSKWVMRKISRKLDLSEEQRDRISPIVRKYIERMQEVRSELRPRLKQISREGLVELKEQLTPKQAGMLEKQLMKYKNWYFVIPKDPKNK